MIKYTTTFVFSILLTTSICFSDFRTGEEIAPDVMYYHVYRSAGPWHIHVLEIDLHSSAIFLQSAKAHNSLFARDKTSTISRRQNRPNHYVVGAINADFFEWNGTPVGGQIINGQLINEPTNRSVFGITKGRIPFIDIISWQGEFILSNDKTHQISGLNEKRNSNEWFLYNSFYTKDTLSQIEGKLIHAKRISEKYCINEPMNFKVTKVDNLDKVILKPDSLRADEIFLVGPSNEIADLNVMDKIQILLSLDPVEEQLDLLVGGLPRIIRDGSISIEWKKENIRESFSSKRHPRTGVGFTKDKQKVLFFVVDGRQPGYSIGMTLSEFASHMLEWDIYQGVNLDGGGSSTIVVHGNVANSPSDLTGERPVANVLMVVNKNEKNKIKRLNIIPDEVIIFPGEDIQFEVNVQDTNFHPLLDESDSAWWSCDQELGTTDSMGLFTADSLATTGFIYVQKRAMIDSAKISIILDGEMINNNYIFEMDH